MDVLLLSPGRLPAPLAALPGAEHVRTGEGFAAPDRRVDVAVATSWEATAHLFAVQADRYAYWVDDLAHHRMGGWQLDRVPAALSYDLPVDFLAAGDWVAAELRALRPEARVLTVVPGLEPPAPAPAPAVDGPADGSLRVRVDGAGVPEGEERRPDAVLAAAAEPCHEVRDGAADVVLRLEPLAGLLGVVRGAAAAGEVPLVLPGAAQPDVAAHLVDGIVLEPDDVRGTARWLDHLARDRDLLARLRGAAIARGAGWPTHAAATQALVAALEQVVAEPPPPDAAWPRRLMADAMAGVALHRADYFVTAGELERLKADETYLAAQAWRRRADDPRLAGVRRAVAPLLRAARRRT